MDNKIKIDVGLDESFKEAKKLLSELQKLNVFKGDKGKRDWNKASGASSVGESLFKKGEITEIELDSLNKSLKTMYDIIDSYTDKIEEVSKEAAWLKEKLRKADAKRESLQEEKRSLKDSVANKKSEFYKSLQDKQIKRINKDGTLSQGKALTPSTLIKKMESGDIDNLGYMGADNQVHKLSGEDFAGLNEIKKAEESLNKLSIVLEKVNAEVDKWEGKLEHQLSKETTAGSSTIAASMQQSASGRRKAKKSSNKMKDAFAAEKDAAVEKTSHEVSSTNEELKKQETTLGRAFKQFTLYNVAIRSARSALREAKQTIEELDKSLTEQAMVTGLTRQQTYGLIKSYQDLAIQVGATTKEVAGVATEYMKQGKTIKDSLTLTKAAVSAAKVARVSVGDSVNYLTTALNGFRLSADQAMRVSDKFAAVAASSATDYDELAIALSKVASQANLAGMSIDYTTALLTKGLETTREAPETMGTALKTIIARMREMKDYGETLEGDTDINNVESQLQYVGIALRNQQGELRSTQDVLDELGKKWDTLNKNQQAAIAKALAGTRQQSRLIAMMDGYERVTELQQTAERSAGATAAQAEVYLEGMEAAINKIRVAWEKVVSALNTEAFIGVANALGTFVNFFAEFLSTSQGTVIVLTTVGVLTSGILGKKLLQWDLAKKQAKAEKEILILQKQQNIESLKAKIAEEKKVDLVKERKILSDKRYSAKNKAEAQRRIDSVEKDPALLAAQEDLVLLQDKFISQEKILAPLELLKNAGMAIQNKLLAAKNVLMAGGNGLQVIWYKLTKQQTKAQLAQNAAANANPYVAVAKAILLVVSAIVAIIAVTKTLSKVLDPVNRATNSVKKLSSEIFNFNKKAQEIDNVVDSFDKVDKKVIKTSKDMKEMTAQVDKMGELMSDETPEKKKEDELTGKMSEKEYYESLETDEAKMEFAKKVRDKNNAEAEKARKEQLKILGSLSEDERKKALEDIGTKDSVHAINNSNLYKTIDKLKMSDESKKNLESISQAMLNTLDGEQSWQLTQDKNGINNLLTKINATGQANTLTNDDAGLLERVEAFRAIRESLEGPEKEAFEKAYSEWAFFADSLSESAVNTLNSLKLSNEAINDIYGSFDKLVEKGLDIPDEEVFKEDLGTFFGVLNEEATNFEEVLAATLGQYADDEKELNALINTIGDHFATGVLDMGQNMDKYKNTINSFYETASKWNTMSESDKSNFISKNQDLFSGEGGKELLEAFEQGEYTVIESALQTQMQDRLKTQLEDVRRTLAVEESRKGKDRNEAYIKQLHEYEDYLTNQEDMFKASLDLRLKQETDQLNEYKNYLKDQQKALKDSLSERKKAYQSYFDAIDRNEADEEYEEKASLLASNLSKLGSSTDAKSISQSKELEKQLADLEKERLKELRSRARDAVMESMDDNVEQINQKFDKLLENNQALLLAMQGDLKDPTKFVGNLIGNKINSGASALEVEKYIQGLQTTYGSAVGNNVDWNNVSVEERNNNLVLNVAGQEINLSRDNQQNLFETIMTALRQIGLR